MTTPLTLTTDHLPNGTVVLKAVGEIDMSNSDALASALKETRSRLVIDLTDVEYLDSAGLNVLFTNAERIELIAGALLTPVLAMSGLSSLVTIHTAGSPPAPLP